MLDGHADRLTREQNDRAWLAWHVAYLTAYAPGKSREFPRLEKLLQRRTERTQPERRQSWEDDFAMMSAWVQSASNSNG